MSAWTNLKPGLKFIIILILVGAIALILSNTGALNKIVPKKPDAEKFSEAVKDKIDDGVPVCNIGVVDWGGYVGGQYYNNGFTASTNSRYYTEKNIFVNFKVLNDLSVSRTAWKTDEVNMLWVTADAFPTESFGLYDYEPVFTFQADWSRGGDVAVATSNIRTVNDLRGKKIAVAEGSPSHSILIMVLKAAGMTVRDVVIVGKPSAIEAADDFKAGLVDVAIVWSPDDQKCLETVVGSHILKSTRELSNIIADGFYVKRKYLKEHFDVVVKVVEGFLIGAGEINTDPAAKEKAVGILAQGLGISHDNALNAINNVRLATYGDNINFFGLGDRNAVTGEQLYTTMSREYMNIGYIKEAPPSWRNVSTTEVINAIHLLGPANDPEQKTVFSAPTKQMETAPISSIKSVTVTFPTGSWSIDEYNAGVIDIQFGQTARLFGNVRIRIEGNTDNVGSEASNMSLSRRRAEAVANYLVNKYGMDRNRFVIVGNGPNKPIDSNETEYGRAKNRRTDFIILQ